MLPQICVHNSIWDTHCLSLGDIIVVSYSDGLRHFTVHSYPLVKRSWVPSSLVKSERRQKDLHFLASTPDDAVRWVSALAELQCFLNCLPQPLKQKGSVDSRDFQPRQPIKCKSPPAMCFILNPRSGRGHSSKVFYDKVEPILKLAGFKLEVVETESMGHARTLARTVNLNTCLDGIICVGGDGIVNEVLNGLINRDDPKEVMTVPIGIIPTGSDNSLVWTMLGFRDPISAAVAIVEGGLTATDVFAVEWIETGAIHAGLMVAYYGFVSDVLELSEKYQKHFGPLRYFVDGALKILFFPKYNYEVEYLPVPKPTTNIGSTGASWGCMVDVAENHAENHGRKSNIEGLPRASSLSSIDSILMTPSRMSGDLDVITSSTYASSEPFDLWINWKTSRP